MLSASTLLTTSPLQTTNGSLLGDYARSLKQNGINRINVSLDTINESKYKKITRFGNLTKVISSINEAIKEGLIIKINVASYKGIYKKLQISRD